MSRLAYFKHDAAVRFQHWPGRIVRCMPRWLREAVIVNAAVNATAPSVVGDGYAGPDGLDYKRLMEHA